MSDAPLSPHQIRAALAAYVPPDPVALDMIPPESREFLSRANLYVAFLLDQLGVHERKEKVMEEALENYARQSGDVLFHQNLDLCLRQVMQQQQSTQPYQHL